METFSALLVKCVVNSPVFFDVRLHKRFSKQWWVWWFETPSRPLWRHSSELICANISQGNCSVQNTRQAIVCLDGMFSILCQSISSIYADQTLTPRYKIININSRKYKSFHSRNVLGKCCSSVLVWKQVFKVWQRIGENLPSSFSTWLGVTKYPFTNFGVRDG